MGEVTSDRAALRWSSAARSATGPHRDINQDRVFEDQANGVWAVADGMGGHADGEEAAEAVVSALGRMKRRTSGYGRLATMRDAFEGVNRDLVGRRTASPGARLSGSTVVSLLAHDDYFACVWAGDSRAYLLREGGLTRLTRDHSLVQDMVDDGLLPEAERDDHPQGHVITRAIGASADLRLDQVLDRFYRGDVFLLCSDGLTACISDREIAALLRDCTPSTADHLMNLALARSPKDNVSFVLIRAT